MAQEKKTIPTQKHFSFSPENLEKANAIIAKYPEGRQRSAVIPLLELAQRQNANWLSRAAMDYVGEMLDVPFIRIYEVATFYTMFNLKPVGEHFIQLCRTTPCWLAGSEGVKKACHDTLGIDVGETTADGKFTLVEVECLGACVNAPMIQVNDDYFEDLDEKSMTQLLSDLAAGKEVKKGSQTGRQTSSPASGLTCLKKKA